MANIIFLVYPFTGPINTSLKLAKLLKEKGHIITYVLPHKFSNRIKSYGFNFDTIEIISDHGKSFSDGYETLELYANYLGSPTSYTSPVFKVFEKLISEHSPDILILDADIIGFAMVAYYYKLKVIVINGLIQGDKAWLVPPYDSNLIPDNSFLYALQVEFEWYKRLIKKNVFYLYDKVIRRKDDIYHLKLASLCGFPLKYYVNRKKLWYYSLRNYPEFNLHPLEFDFPRKCVPKNQKYVGAMVDVNRDEGNTSEFDLLFVKPVVLCSLGTIAEVYSTSYKEFLKKIVVIFENRPDVNLILAVGSCVDISELRSCASNIFIYNFVPQLHILKNAKLMITHAGMNSIKECIYYGVPMMAYPLSEDGEQKGNAARILYHGLGRRGDLNQDSILKITEDIGEVLTNPLYRSNVLKMNTIFRKYESKEGEVIKFIEDYIM